MEHVEVQEVDFSKKKNNNLAFSPGITKRSGGFLDDKMCQ